MERRKIEVSNKSKPDFSKRISLLKRNKINVECAKLFRISSDPLEANKLWENYLEISNILEKIKTLEEKKIGSSSRFDAIDKFVSWLKQSGAQIDGVRIYNFSDYQLGLQADRDFKEGELILTIPRNLIFSVHSAAAELTDMQSDMLIQHMPQVALAIALLIEKHKSDSKWKPYLDIFPKEYPTILYMRTDDLLELKGSPSLDAALKHCRNIARQYSYFYRLFLNNENAVSNLLRDSFTYEEYRWAVSTVMTRQNIIPSSDDSQMIHGLIPMWDMCNHEEGEITTDFNQFSKCCECYAMRNFNSGDQIFIYYGPRTNTDFFVHSGFVYPGNKNDGFKIRLGISKSDMLYTERVQLLAKIGLPAVNEYLLKPGPTPISGSLLGFLRIFNMDKCDLDYWLKSDSVCDIINSNCKFRNSIDKTVLKFIVTRLKLLLANYRTSAQDDIELLKTTLNPYQKLVLQMRLSEKKILHNVLAVLENSENL